MILNTNHRWPKDSRHHLIQRLATAFVLGDIPHIMTKITDDITLDIVGEQRLEGRKELETALQKMSNKNVIELSIDHILVEGDRCAINGDMTVNGDQVFEFADFYTFASGTNKIKSIQSYVLAIN